ncbi:MFS transporter [Actinacidiphila bryophytorum]|uniref:MFS transporter n=1 Tax=Actinacidiphila bryophytorum TaxID=1436133 RepID=A0A9W4MJ11_9ACTN|nr:MFS transporter [Actinacidiphila bryophytorum]
MPAIHSRIDVKKLPIILGLAIAFGVTVVDPLVLSLNLPQVSRALQVPPGLVGLLSGAATLVMAAAVLAVGSLADSFGLKRVLMLGLATVAFVNLLSTLSPGFGYLLAMRFLDGLGLAALLGLSYGLLKTSVQEEERPKAIGLFVATEVVLCGAAPAFGGWVVAAVGWRWLFLVPALLSLVSLWLTARYVPGSPVGRRRRLDVAGVGLVGVALLTAVVGVAAAQNGVCRPQTWAPLAVSAGCGVLFVLRERRVPEPALDLGLFRSPAFSLALAANLTLNFIGGGFGFALGQFGGVVLSLSPQTIGLLFLPGTLLVAGAVSLAGVLVGRYTPRPVMVAGLLVTAASGLVMAVTAGPAMALGWLVLTTWLCNLGTLVTSTAVSETVLSHAPPGRSGTVASVQQAFGMTGYAFGPTVYLLLFNVFFQQQWLQDAKARGLSVTEAESAVDAVRSGAAISTSSSGYDPNLLQQASGLKLGVDFADALRLTMLTVSALPLLLATAVRLLMPRRAGRQA